MNHLIVPLFNITSAASTAVYDVGPGYAKTRLSDVVWDQLQPGGYHDANAMSALYKTSPGSPYAI